MMAERENEGDEEKEMEGKEVDGVDENHHPTRVGVSIDYFAILSVLLAAAARLLTPRLHARRPLPAGDIGTGPRGWRLQPSIIC